MYDLVFMTSAAMAASQDELVANATARDRIQDDLGETS